MIKNGQENKTPETLTAPEYLETDKAATDLTKQSNVYRNWPSVDPNQNPVQFLLKTALIESWDRVLKYGDQIRLIGQNLGDQQSITKIQSIMEGMIQALNDTNELLGWMFPVDRIISFREALKIAHIAHEVGTPEDFVEDLTKQLTNRRRGRPKTAREPAIRALEKKILEPDRKWSWRELAQQFCTCRKPKHDFQCRERIRQSVMGLERVLRKYGTGVGV